MYSHNEVWRRSKGEKEKRKRDLSLTDKGLKECFDCYQVLAIGMFSPSIRGIAGVSAYCRNCTRVKASLIPKEVHNLRTKEWRKGNRKWAGQHRDHQHRRRAKKESCPFTEFLQSDIDRIYEQQCCFYCGLSTPREKRTLDHVTPLYSGGAHAPSNAVMACGSCNFSKHNKPVEVFIRKFAMWRQKLIIRTLGELGIDGYTSQSRVTTRVKEPSNGDCSLYVATDI